MGAKQGTTTKLPGSSYGTNDGGKGSVNQARIKAAFPDSPLYNDTPDQLNDDGTLSSKMRAYYQTEVLSGEQSGNTLMGSVDMDYGAAVAPVGPFGGGAGEAANRHVPNVASPGEGNGANPKSQPVAPAVTGHEGNLGTTTGPESASKTQGSFNLTNLPPKGNSPK